MGKNQDLELPATPTYKTDPVFSKGYNDLYNYGSQLTKGDFTGDLSWLSPTINGNNNGSLALAGAQGILQPQFSDTLQQITNSAASNGQLNSSTFTDALAKAGSDLNSQYQSIVSQQAISDNNQSNANRLKLFGTGLNTLNQATSFGFNNQNAENQFNLSNYDNLVAQAIQKNSNANQANAFQQVLGYSPVGHDFLKSQGITNLPGYGLNEVAGIAGSFMGAGSLDSSLGGMSGGSAGGGQQLSNIFRSGGSAPAAGAYAMNPTNPYMDSSQFSPNYYGLLN